MRSSRISTRNITLFAILFALEVILQAVLANIQIGLVQLNFALIPIVLAALMFGMKGGAAMGFINGVIVLIQVIMGMVPFYTVIWDGSPIVTTLTCIVKTTIAGLVSGLVFDVLKKKNAIVAVFLASGIVPIVNTALFIVGCFCMNASVMQYRNSLIDKLPQVAGMNAFVFIIIILVTYNFFIEFAINLIIAPSLYRVLKIVDKLDYFKQNENSQEEKYENEGNTIYDGKNNGDDK